MGGGLEAELVTHLLLGEFLNKPSSTLRGHCDPPTPNLFCDMVTVVHISWLIAPLVSLSASPLLFWCLLLNKHMGNWSFQDGEEMTKEWFNDAEERKGCPEAAFLREDSNASSPSPCQRFSHRSEPRLRKDLSFPYARARFRARKKEQKCVLNIYDKKESLDSTYGSLFLQNTSVEVRSWEDVLCSADLELNGSFAL